MTNTQKQEIEKWYVNRYGRITESEKQLLNRAYEEGSLSKEKEVLKVIDECKSHSWEGHKCILVEELKSKIKEK